MATSRNPAALGPTIEGAVSRIQREGRVVFERVEREVERNLAAVETAVRARLGLADPGELASLRHECRTLSERVGVLERRVGELTGEVSERLRLGGD